MPLQDTKDSFVLGPLLVGTDSHTDDAGALVAAIEWRF